jgi:hypothetical protein
MVDGLTLWFPLIDKSVADANLAPVSTKTAVTGVNTSFTMDINCPPMGSIFGVTVPTTHLLGIPNLSASASDDLNNWLDARSLILNSNGLNNWQDGINVLPGYLVQAFDSMFFNLADDFQLFMTGGSSGGGSSADQLVLSDSFTALLSGAFADSFDKQLLSTNAFGDQMFMSDLAGLQLNLGLIFGDTGSMTDGTGNSASTQLLVTVSDTLNSPWMDAVTTLSSTSETTYLRQYLNDVVN